MQQFIFLPILTELTVNTLLLRESFAMSVLFFIFREAASSALSQIWTGKLQVFFMNKNLSETHDMAQGIQ